MGSERPHTLQHSQEVLCLLSKIKTGLIVVITVYPNLGGCVFLMVRLVEAAGKSAKLTEGVRYPP